MMSITMAVSMMVVSRFSNSFSLSLSIVSMMSITMMTVSMVVVSWFSYSLSFSLSIVSMMSIAMSIMAISMVVVARISYSYPNNRNNKDNLLMIWLEKFVLKDSINVLPEDSLLDQWFKY